MAMQSDPKFGTDSHGHLSRLLVERCYVMMDERRTMMADNAWQSYPEFRSYMNGREGLPLLGNIDAGGREFMDAAATAFFDIFLSSMVKHVEEQWTSEMLLPYIIGGSPELAKEFLLWLRACEDGQLEAENFHFTDKEIELENLKAYGEGHTSNVAECMRYLTSKSNPTAILKDPLIADMKELLFESLNAQDTVDFNDKTTWGDKDYTAIANLIHQAIVPHASNQQRIEGDVQKINIMSQIPSSSTHTTVHLSTRSEREN